jgi:hypothetical protein
MAAHLEAAGGTLRSLLKRGPPGMRDLNEGQKIAYEIVAEPSA